MFQMYLLLPSEVLHVHIIKACGEVAVTSSPFLNLELAKVSGQPQPPSQFTTEERAPQYYRIGGFVGP
jgi:hypothetical protein